MMSIKDLETRFNELDKAQDETNIGIAVIIERLKHIPTNEKLDERIDKRINSNLSTYKTVFKVVVPIVLVTILFLTGTRLL